MHLRIKSDFILEPLQLDLQQSTNPRIIKTNQNSTQNLETQICSEMLLGCKTERSFSPKTKRNQKRNLIKSNQSWVNDDDQEYEEHSIWGDSEQIPVGNNTENTLIQFLELYKYRYERTMKRPVSSYNVIQQKNLLIDILPLKQNILESINCNGLILEIGVNEQIFTFMILYLFQNLIIPYKQHQEQYVKNIYTQNKEQQEFF